MNLQDRIQTIIRVNGLTASSFADKIGVQRSSVSHILNGRNKPSLDFIEKVLDHFPRVNAGWLVTGKSPGQSESGSQPEAIPDASPFENNDEPEETEQIEEETLSSAADQDKPQAPLSLHSARGEGKPIERIVIFYKDRSFEEYVEK